MKNLITGLLIGLFAGLWLTEQRKNQPRGAASARQSRTLEEMSPTYTENPHMHKELHVIRPDNLYSYVNGITTELIQGDLTELEVKNVQDYIRKLILNATTYYRSREKIENPPARDWLDDMIDERFFGDGS